MEACTWFLTNVSQYVAVSNSLEGLERLLDKAVNVKSNLKYRHTHTHTPHYLHAHLPSLLYVGNAMTIENF